MRPLLLSLLVPALALAAPGDLDPMFGNGGTVVSVPATGLRALVIQPSGRIVVGAGRRVGPEHGQVETALVGVRPDGRLDPGFGDGGVTFDPALGDIVLALEPDGGLLGAGTRCGAGGCVTVVRRYDRDGHHDPTFGGPGTLVVATPTIVDAIARQPDGHILVGGNAGHAPAFWVWIARSSADGRLEPGFGTDGIASALASSHGAGISNLAIQRDGAVVAGVTGAAIEGSYARLVRFAPDGSSHDAVPVPFGGPRVAQTAAGDLVTAGTLRTRDGPAPHIGAARFTRDLALDAGFAAGLFTGPPGFATDLIVQSDGKPVIAGGVGPYGAEQFALLRLTAGGAPDEEFGDHGLVSVFPGARSAALRLAAQADGKLVAAGILGPDLVLARFLVRSDGAPTPPTTTSTTITASTSTSTTLVSACPTGCDDGDACTIDRCEGTRCVHEAATGFAAIRCRCAPVLAGCSEAPGFPRRIARACRLVDAARGAPTARELRLTRRAARLLVRTDRQMTRAMAAGHTPSCMVPLATRVGELSRTARALLRDLRTAR
jgi:uncharacterized delta-60 repeat protein